MSSFYRADLMSVLRLRVWGSSSDIFQDYLPVFIVSSGSATPFSLDRRWVYPTQCFKDPVRAIFSMDSSGSERHVSILLGVGFSQVLREEDHRHHFQPRWSCWGVFYKAPHCCEKVSHGHLRFQLYSTCASGGRTYHHSLRVLLRLPGCCATRTMGYRWSRCPYDKFQTSYQLFQDLDETHRETPYPPLFRALTGVREHHPP